MVYSVRPLPLNRKAKMTPQELERTLEFILQHEARTDARLDRLAERQGEMQSMMRLMTELAEVQSQRLDRHDEMFRRHDEMLRAMLLWQREALSRLDQILSRLT